MPPVGRGANPNIDGHIEDRTARAPDKLALRVGWRLVVQPTEHAFLRGTHVVVVNEAGFNALRRKNIRAKCLGKEPSLIASPASPAEVPGSSVSQRA